MQQNIITITSYKKIARSRFLCFICRGGSRIPRGFASAWRGQATILPKFLENLSGIRENFGSLRGRAFCAPSPPNPDPPVTFLEPTRIVFGCKARKCSVIVAPHGHCIFTKCIYMKTRVERNCIYLFYVENKFQFNSTELRFRYCYKKKPLNPWLNV